MGIELEYDTELPRWWTIHCDVPHTAEDLRLARCWGRLGQYATTDEAKLFARCHGWTERDGRWYCPAHAERPGAEKGGET